MGSRCRQKPSNIDGNTRTTRSNDADSLTKHISTRAVAASWNRWVRALPLDEGEGDDADAGTDMTIPEDDDGDISSFSSQQTATVQNL